MTKDNERDLKRDLQIDEHDLQAEWLTLATIYHHWAMELADAVFERDALKARIDVAKARASQKIRDSSDKKPAEATIADMVRTDAEIIELQEQYGDASYRVDELQAVRDALSSKKLALEMITRIRMADWTSEPDIPKGYQQKVSDEESERQRQSLGTSSSRVKPKKMTKPR